MRLPSVRGKGLPFTVTKSSCSPHYLRQLSTHQLEDAQERGPTPNPASQGLPENFSRRLTALRYLRQVVHSSPSARTHLDRKQASGLSLDANDMGLLSRWAELSPTPWRFRFGESTLIPESTLIKQGREYGVIPLPDSWNNPRPHSYEPFLGSKPGPFPSACP